MDKQIMTKEEIKKRIAQDQLADAIEQLMTLVNAYLLIHPKAHTVPKIQQILIVNSGKYKGLEQDEVLGILNRADEQTTIAQVRKALLYVIEELPEKVWQSKIDAKAPNPPSPSTQTSDFDFDLFLSFSSKDREAARLIWETLRGLGYRVFLSDEALKAYAGMSFLEKINSALRKSQHFLLLCTPTAVESPWVKLECETFFTRFHLPQAQQRRFFIFERGGKNALDDVYHNLQTLEDLSDLIELLQSLNGPSNKATLTATFTIVDPVVEHKPTQSEKALEVRLQQEQTQLEQAASAEASASLGSSKADLVQVKNSAMLIDFYQKYGENPTPEFYQLHESIIQNFGTISELELDDLIAELAKEAKERELQELQRKRIIEVEIPQSIQAFVRENKGEWTRRTELSFFDELIRHFNGVMAKPALSNLLEDAKRSFQQTLQDFILIKGGTFLMGAPKNERDAAKEEKPQHPVKVSDFYLSKYPVTLAQFEEFILVTGYQTDADKDGGSNFWTGSKWDKKAGVNWSCDVNGNPQQDKEHPVIHVSWNDAKAYCNWLAQKLNLPVRLPREAEWEYACRAGATTPFNTGENLTTEQANYDGNFPYADFPKGTYLSKTSKVGTYPANAWGLYDMHGNVWEWCEDWHSESWYDECKKQGMVLDPTGPATGSARVLRGGSWGNSARYCRTALRFRDVPVLRHTFAGFRPVVSL